MTSLDRGATRDAYGEIALLAKHHTLDQQKDFLQLLEIYEQLADLEATPALEPLTDPVLSGDLRPDIRFLQSGDEAVLQRLSELRAISMDGLRYASSRGVLKFGDWHGQKVYAVLDGSGLNAELRRLDGKMFPAYENIPAHKSHTLKHSRKNWPVGLPESSACPWIALAEGMPDFLCLHEFIAEQRMQDKAAPVAMLASGVEIAADALLYFKARSVRMFPHLDPPGVDAAERWCRQLKNAGAGVVDFVRFPTRVAVKDLCDFNQLRKAAALLC
jgi:hypothetical protein